MFSRVVFIFFVSIVFDLSPIEPNNQGDVLVDNCLSLFVEKSSFLVRVTTFQRLFFDVFLVLINLLDDQKSMDLGLHSL